MALSDILRRITLDDMGTCNYVILGHPSLSSYFAKNHDTIKILYDNHLLTDKDIDSLLVSKVVEEARKYVKMMNTTLTAVPGGEKITDHTYADHVLRTDFLAYAMEIGGLFPEEIKKIKFDHGENAYNFVLRYRKPDLIENLRKDLLSTKPTIISESPPSNIFDYDEHHACSCGH